MKIAYYSDARSMTSTIMLEESIRHHLGQEIEFVPLKMEQIGSLYSGNIDVFIVPGIAGETCHYHSHLGGSNGTVIKSFVSNGGVYLGLCAGAFYAMTHIEYTDQKNITTKRDTPFGFINGTAIGPVTGKNLFPSNEMLRGFCGVRPINLVGKFANYAFDAYSLYSSGPTFKATEDVEVLGVFRDNSEHPPALIAKYFGKGLVIASSTVPYHLNDSFTKISSPNLSSDAKEIFNGLQYSLREHAMNCSKYWSLILATTHWHRKSISP